MATVGRDVRIVMVRPRNPLNLLAAARAATNFGFRDIIVVAPHPPVWEEARAARGASQWLRHARLAASTLEAVADRDWVLGTSSLSRRRPEESRSVLSLDHVIARARKAKQRRRVALVFGPEKRGLSNQDLNLCHNTVRIPTIEDSASMNLGQAVAVCCYELRAWGLFSLPQVAPAATAATLEEVTRLTDAVEKLLSPNHIADRRQASRRRMRLLRLLLRWPVSSQDVGFCLGAVRDLAWKLGQSV